MKAEMASFVVVYGTFGFSKMELEDAVMDLSLDRLEDGKWKYAQVHFGGKLFKEGGDIALGFTSRLSSSGPGL